MILWLILLMYQTVFYEMLSSLMMRQQDYIYCKWMKSGCFSLVDLHRQLKISHSEILMSQNALCYSVFLCHRNALSVFNLCYETPLSWVWYVHAVSLVLVFTVSEWSYWLHCLWTVCMLCFLYVLNLYNVISCAILVLLHGRYQLNAALVLFTSYDSLIEGSIRPQSSPFDHRSATVCLASVCLALCRSI